MGKERRIASYLMKYGNTRENDLISFGAKKLGCSPEEMKKALDRMVVMGKIHRIVHNKLEPPEVYISLMEPLPPEIMRSLIEVSDAKEVERESAAILREAASIAEQRLREECL